MPTKPSPGKGPAEHSDDAPSLKVEPRLYTMEQTATYLNVSSAQVYALVRSGELPAIKLGGRGVWRVDRYRLDEWLERLQRETQAWAKANPLNRKATAPSEEDESDPE